eukprot:gene15398-biopygen16972
MPSPVFNPDHHISRNFAYRGVVWVSVAAAALLLWWYFPRTPVIPLGTPSSLQAESTFTAAAEGAQAAAAGQVCEHTRLRPLSIPMANQQPPCLERPVVLLFGDSLTERSFDPEGGWGASLAHHYVRKVDVLNRGFGGYNSRWGMKLLEQVLQQLRDQKRTVVLMTLWFGANDAALPGRSAERQHVPVAEYTQNLEQMVAMARAAGATGLVLITPPPVGDATRIKHQQMRMGISTPILPDRTLEHAGLYAAAVKALGAKLELPVVDLYSKLQEYPGWELHLFNDGLHFTPAGARQVWQHLKATLEGNFPKLKWVPSQAAPAGLVPVAAISRLNEAVNVKILLHLLT